jgi:sugar phosphate isomerase/epimerase
MTITRRDFGTGALMLAAGGALGAVKSPPSDFPVDPRSRIAVASYPFRGSIAAPHNHDRDTNKSGMDLPAFARFIKSEFQVSGIEPLDSHFPSKERSEIVKLRGAFDSAGVHTVNIPVDEEVELCSDDQAKRESGNASYRHWVDIAVILGSPSIRIWIPKCADTSDLPKAVKALQPTIDYATTQNIVVNLENDDPVYSPDTRVLAAIRLADSPYFRALPDFGNALMAGDERFNAGVVQRMFTRAWNVAHVKDAESIDGKRKTVSLAELFGIAKAAGYRGYYSMESDSNVDPFTDTKQLIEQSLRLI